MDARPDQTEDEYGLVHHWRFEPSLADPWFRRQRIKDFLFRLCPAPPSKVLKAATAAPRWILYFVYLPDGKLTPAHRFTLDRLKAEAMKLLIVCAAPRLEDVPAELGDIADALIWKGMAGFDFSAFAVGLGHLAKASPGSDIFVMNDSVLGPLAPLGRFMDEARFDLTGITGSRNDENHVQSYAFILRGVTRSRLWQLRSIFPPGLAFNDFAEVVRTQETRMARVAAKRMSVGAFWFAARHPENPDPTLFTAGVLLDQGFPFVKKSALAKFRHVVGEAVASDLDNRLSVFGHPPFP